MVRLHLKLQPGYIFVCLFVYFNLENFIFTHFSLSFLLPNQGLREASLSGYVFVYIFCFH